VPNIFLYITAGMAVGAVLAFSGTDAERRTDPPDAIALQQAAERIGTAADIDALLATCPADVWLTRADEAGRGIWGEGSCLRDFGDCVEACVTDSSPSACRYTARAIELSDDPFAMDPAIDLSRRQAYALACALGSAQGCTNRGAALRNAARLAPDPLSDLDPSLRDLCLHRSFALACDAGSAWGCAMSGQAYHLGEGVERDDAQARTQLQRACVDSAGIEPEDAARAPCRFARDLLARMTSD
jgi:TPR repeat protein